MSGPVRNVAALLKDARLRTLYDQLRAEAARFPQYNFRETAFRKIDDAFGPVASKAEANAVSAHTPGEEAVQACLKRGHVELARLKRMTTVATLFSSRPAHALDA